MRYDDDHSHQRNKETKRPVLIMRRRRSSSFKIFSSLSLNTNYNSHPFSTSKNRVFPNADFFHMQMRACGRSFDMQNDARVLFHLPALFRYRK